MPTAPREITAVTDLTNVHVAERTEIPLATR